MSIIQDIKEYFKERRLKRLEMDILSIRNKLNFDPRFSVLDGDPQTTEAFTHRISEYKVWSMGNASVIRRFYRGTAGNARNAVNKLNYFWANAPTTARLVHSGIPGLISTRMADILFGSGVDVDVVVYKDMNAENLKEDAKTMKIADELMSTILGAIGFQDKIQTAATNESWGGHCFFKLSHDVDVSRFPIVETYDITRAEVVKVRGITKAIIFKSWYTHKDQQYRLDEVYSTTAEGYACISYHLFRRGSDGSDKEVDLFSIPQTAQYFHRFGEGNEHGIHLNENNTIVYEGLKGMLAFEKPNKTPSLEFPDSDYGASDYEGSIDSFDALDEIVSGNIHEIRTNKTRRYVPSSFIPRNPHNPEEVLPFDEFDDSYVYPDVDPDQETKKEIKVVTVADKTESFMSKWKSILSTICNKAKISPYSLGITWLEAVGPGADSLRERNKTTLDMRDGKLKLWKPFLEEMLLRVLQLYAWMYDNAVSDKDGLPQIPFAWENTTVRVSFGEYVGDTYWDMLPKLGAAKAQHVASTQECVERLHPDWTSEQRQNEINLIRFEEGMSVDNPNSLPELTGEGGEE